MKLAAVWTGLSSESSTTKLTTQVIKTLEQQLAKRGETLEVTRINLHEYAKQITFTLLTPVPDPKLEAAFQAVKEADTLITIAPIYKGTPIGIHTLFWQLIEDGALWRKPVLMGATGGTARHSLAIEYSMRPLLNYLKGNVMPSNIFAATDDWANTAGAAQLQARITYATNELTTALFAQQHAASLAELANTDALTTLANTNASTSQNAHITAVSAADNTAAPTNWAKPENLRTADTIELIDKETYLQQNRLPKRKRVTADLFDPHNVTPFAQLLGNEGN